jgi:hypothetical protein
MSYSKLPAIIVSVLLSATAALSISQQAIAKTNTRNPGDQPIVVDDGNKPGKDKATKERQPKPRRTTSGRYGRVN